MSPDKRTLEVLAAARKRGKALDRNQKVNLVALRQGGQSLLQLARTFGVSKTTIIRYLRIAKSSPIGEHD